MKTEMPHAQGQLWRNKFYKNNALHDYVASFYENYFYVRANKHPKYFLSPYSYGGITFLHGKTSLSSELQHSSCMFACDFFGDPHSELVFSKLYSGLSPAGFYDKPVISGIWNVLKNLPFIPYKVLRLSRQLNNPSNKINSGNKISTGIRKVCLRESRLNPIQEDISLSCIGKAGDFFYKEVYSDTYSLNDFRLCDLFVSVNILSNPQIGTFILPTGSVFWMWSNTKNDWITCVCEYTMPKKFPNGIMTVSFREVDDEGIAGNVVYTEKGREESIHKKIAKLIDSDSIRIALRNFNKISVGSSTRKIFNDNVSLEYIRLFCSNYSSSVFNQLKTTIVKNTDHSDIETLDRLCNYMVNSYKKSITCEQYSNSLMLFTRKQAYISNKDKVPLFWNIGKATLLDSNNDEVHTINQDTINISNLGYKYAPSNSEIVHHPNYLKADAADQSPDTLHHVYRSLGIKTNEVSSVAVKSEEVNFKLKLKVKRVEEQQYFVTLEDKYSVPSYIVKNGDQFVDKYIRQMLSSSRINNAKNWETLINMKAHRISGKNVGDNDYIPAIQPKTDIQLVNVENKI